MTYEKYYKKFNKNDDETFSNLIPNDKAIDFLMENAPRLYCPDKIIEETFAFRTWTMRKHIKDTPAGYLISEFLPDVSWAGKYNIINAPLYHHLKEFRWLKNSSDFLDYICFFIKGEGSPYSYSCPALSAMYDFCITTKNEQFLIDNIECFEKYFDGWEERHLTKNGLFWAIDDREATEYTISGTTLENKMTKGLRPLINSAMYGDAMALSKIEKLCNNFEKSKYYKKRAKTIKKHMDEKMWDGTFYKAIHPKDQDLDKNLTYKDIPNECNAREFAGYLPWIYNMPDKGKEHVFKLLKDKKVFSGKMGLTTADRSHPRYMFAAVNNKACTWSGKVWPFATSFIANAIIELLNNYDQDVISNKDLFDIIKKYAKMHYIIKENGKKINFIDEVMHPDEPIWICRESLKTRSDAQYIGGKDRGKDYNHSTFIDIVLRGLCGIKEGKENLTIEPKIKGIWDWFKIENLTYRKQNYTIYYDENGDKFNKGKGIIIEKN